MVDLMEDSEEVKWMRGISEGVGVVEGWEYGECGNGECGELGFGVWEGCGECDME